jgi:hypothetical protein
MIFDALGMSSNKVRSSNSLLHSMQKFLPDFFVVERTFLAFVTLGGSIRLVYRNNTIATMTARANANEDMIGCGVCVRTSIPGI